MNEEPIVEVKREDVIGLDDAHSLFVLGHRAFFACKKEAAERFKTLIEQAIAEGIRRERDFNKALR